jgi:hypothetical protein
VDRHPGIEHAEPQLPFDLVAEGFRVEHEPHAPVGVLDDSAAVGRDLRHHVRGLSQVRVRVQVQLPTGLTEEVEDFGEWDVKGRPRCCARRHEFVQVEVR